jgi:hypothetical protein
VRWRKNNPEVNYSPNQISGGRVSRESITQQEKEKGNIVRYMEF